MADGEERCFCPKCDKPFSTKGNLARHCLNQHNWCLTKSAPVKPQEQSKEAAQGVAMSEDVIQLESDSEVSAAVEGLLAAGSGAAQNTDRMSDVEPSPRPSADQEHAVNKTWEEAIVPKGEVVDPTARKRSAVTQPHCPPRKNTGNISTASATPKGKMKARSSSEPRLPLSQKYKVHVAKWPNRAARPPIRDIIGYRTTLPPSVTPEEIGELARTRFAWGETKTVTPQHYVQGVVAAYDAGRRSTWNTISEYLREAPESNPSPEERLAWIQRWAKDQIIPDPPEQEFLD